MPYPNERTILCNTESFSISKFSLYLQNSFSSSIRVFGEVNSYSFNKSYLSSEKFLYPLDKSISKVKLSYLPSEEGKKPVIFEYFTLRVSLAEKIQLDPKTKIFVDEAGMISTKLMNGLLTEMDKARSTGVFIGDVAQISSISGSNTFREFFEDSIISENTLFLKEITRQKDKVQLEIAQAVSFASALSEVKQNDLKLYVFKLTAEEIHNHFVVSRRLEDKEEGYQRIVKDKKIKEIL